MKTNKEIIEEMIKYFDKLDIVKSKDIPDISLYMDQVTGFIDEKLESFKRGEKDKLLTKTMINNYAKNRLLPPPNKKKYSKDHMMLLILIYFYKNVLSFADIESLFSSIIENHFEDGEDSFSELYDILVTLESEKKREIISDFEKRLSYAGERLENLEPRDENLELFTFLSDMVLEVYFKQHLIEFAIDILKNERS